MLIISRERASLLDVVYVNVELRGSHLLLKY